MNIISNEEAVELAVKRLTAQIGYFGNQKHNDAFYGLDFNDKAK